MIENSTRPAWGARRAIVSLGAYPTDSYYDPNRPAWLPNWIDTPTESAQKYGMYGGANVNTQYPNPLPAPPPPAPMDEQMETYTPEQHKTAVAASWADRLRSAIPAVPDAGGLGAGWIYLGLGLAAILVLRGVKK